MPTASRLVAALLLGGLAYGLAVTVVPHLDEQIRVGLFRETSAVFGVAVGWLFLGPRSGRGVVNALGIGLTAAVFMVLLVHTWFAGVFMIKRSLRMSYGGPVEALEDMVQIAVDNVAYIAHPEFAAGVVLGGLVIGFVTELVARVLS